VLSSSPIKIHFIEGNLNDFALYVPLNLMITKIIRNAYQRFKFDFIHSYYAI
jgi:hypothetical protein